MRKLCEAPRSAEIKRFLFSNDFDWTQKWLNFMWMETLSGLALPRLISTDAVLMMKNFQSFLLLTLQTNNKLQWAHKNFY